MKPHIGGWIGELDHSEPPDVMLGSMLSAAPAKSSSRSILKATPGAALHIDAEWDGKGDGSGERADTLWAAIQGHPRWSSQELARVALREGQVAAVKYAYRQFGPALLQKLRGAFSLAVLDRDARRLLLAIDRFGQHTMCYRPMPGKGIIFGSTLDIVRRHRAISSPIHPQGIFSYLYFGVCPSPETIYRDLYKLQPAQFLFYDDGKITTDFYWRMPYAERVGDNLESLTEELHSLLEQAIDRATAGRDAKVLGAFLSGGLDSSTVVGLLSRRHPNDTKAFTIGFASEPFDEMHYARIACEHFKVKHHTHYLTARDIADAVFALAKYSDEPFGNSSVFPAYYCAKMAAETGVELMIAGDGGDEIFAGNSRYVEQKIYELYSRIPVTLRHYVIEPLALNAPGGILRRVRNYVQRAKVPLPDRLEARNLFEIMPSTKILHHDLCSEIDAKGPIKGLREAYFATQSSQSLRRMLNMDLKITLADNDLRKVDRACGMAGLSAVYPFLDDDLVEFSGRIPPNLLIRGFKRRYFYKRAMRGFLPAEIITKKKHGFGMPYGDWLREDPKLRSLALDCISDFKERHFLSATFLDRLIAHEKAKDASSDGGLAWDIMMLEIWLRDKLTGSRTGRASVA